MPGVMKRAKKLVVLKAQAYYLSREVKDAALAIINQQKVSVVPSSHENLPQNLYWKNQEALIELDAVEFDVNLTRLESAVKMLRRHSK